MGSGVSPGFLGGPWEGSSGSRRFHFGVPGVLWLSLEGPEGVPRGLLGRPWGLLGEGAGHTENTEGFLRVSGGVQGASWGEFSRLECSSGPTW